jgi:hypothetical protein
MKFSPLTASGAALFLLLATSSARADLIPWAYSWSSSPSDIHADAHGSSYITLTDEPGGLVIGDSDVVATNIRTHSTVPADHPDSFTHANYTLSLYLYDPASHASATLVFTGYLDGTLSASNSNISNTFTGPDSQTVVLGQHRFVANELNYTPPGVPGSVNAGSIAGHITIHVESVMTPEPTTLTLSGVAFVVLGVVRVRRRRKRAATERVAT